MKRFYQITLIAVGLATLSFIVARNERAIGQQFARPPAHPVDPNAKPGTPGVFTDFKGEAPGNMHHITAADMPDPYATKSAAIFSRPVPKPADAWPQAPAGFKVTLYAESLKGDDGNDPPRTIITAPNGDFFVASTNKGKILVFHGMTADGKTRENRQVRQRPQSCLSASRFILPARIPSMFTLVTRMLSPLPIRKGRYQGPRPQEVVVPNLPAGPNHFSRGVAFSLDGKQMCISVGSHNNCHCQSIPIRKLEFHRADILVDQSRWSESGRKGPNVYASGIRNGSGIAVDPHTGELWTSVNERDEIGDNLPPDYITHVQEGGFYGWPWYYTGGNPDPRFPGKHPELKDKAIVPDVLHGAPRCVAEHHLLRSNAIPQAVSGTAVRR